MIDNVLLYLASTSICTNIYLIIDFPKEKKKKEVCLSLALTVTKLIKGLTTSIQAYQLI